MNTIICEKCKFADKKALKKWNEARKGPQGGYCTYPFQRDIDKDGNCHSGREKR